MSMNLGYAVGTAIFAVIFLAAVIAQVAAKKFHPFFTGSPSSPLPPWAHHGGPGRSFEGLGYAWGSALLLALVLSSSGFGIVHGLGAVGTVSSPKSEIFFWVTIMFSQTLGTALGDWAADDAGLGYLGGVAVFGGALLVLGHSTTLQRYPERTLWALSFSRGHWERYPAICLTSRLRRVEWQLAATPLPACWLRRSSSAFWFFRSTRQRVLISPRIDRRSSGGARRLPA